LYFTEPFAFAGASMGGGGSYTEGLTRARNSRLWLIDLDQGAKLVAEGFTFMNGIVVDQAPRESSLLVTESTNSRLLRMQLSGPNAGNFEVLQESLPGLPDGLDRDPQGRLWIGMIKERTPLLSWLHNHPWTKPLLLRLPRWLLPVPKKTGVMALSADGKTPLYVTIHDGKRVPEITAVSAGKDGLYPSRYQLGTRGFTVMPYPAGLALQGNSGSSQP
jgi:sugar lactone lactonase YvrE